MPDELDGIYGGIAGLGGGRLRTDADYQYVPTPPVITAADLFSGWQQTSADYVDAGHQAVQLGLDGVKEVATIATRPLNELIDGATGTVKEILDLTSLLTLAGVALAGFLAYQYIKSGKARQHAPHVKRAAAAAAKTAVLAAV